MTMMTTMVRVGSGGKSVLQILRQDGHLEHEGAVLVLVLIDDADELIADIGLALSFCLGRGFSAIVGAPKVRRRCASMRLMSFWSTGVPVCSS
jgi:hypothetical protein